MDNASPPVSPSVVANILVIQKTRVTSGTLLRASLVRWFIECPWFYGVLAWQSEIPASAPCSPGWQEVPLSGRIPIFGEESLDEDRSATYQSKVSNGSLVVKRLRQNFLQVVVPGGMGHQLLEVARADFNGDGIEDILLFEYCWATEGTLGFGGIHILTRKSID